MVVLDLAQTTALPQTKLDFLLLNKQGQCLMNERLKGCLVAMFLAPFFLPMVLLYVAVEYYLERTSSNGS